MILKGSTVAERYQRNWGVDGVNQIWRDAKLRAAGLARAKTLVTAAEHSAGSQRLVIAQGLN